MSVHPRRDTGPELAIRRMLHAAGERYRVNYPVPGLRRRTIDIAFTKAKLAVFVDGCFWHGCPDHRSVPASNREWWTEKLSRNRERDLTTTSALELAGWRVVRCWEHDSVDEAVGRIQTELRALRGH
jgi:DNA mismatch endonuclease, patch repair protein